MLDRERADFFRTLESLKEAFGPHVVATEIPIGSEHETRGVIDLIDMKAFVYEGEGRGNADEEEIPEELQEQAEEYREKLMDEVAENSDELMERYLEGEEISHDEIVDDAEEGRHRGAPLPGHLRGRDQEPRAPAGCSRRSSRTFPRRRCAAPSRRSTRTARRSQIEPDPDGELVAYVFKTTADPYTGRINLLRVYSGVLRSDSQVLNATRAEKERIGQLAVPQGKEHETVDELGAGRHRRRREAARDPRRRRARRREGRASCASRRSTSRRR